MSAKFQQYIQDRIIGFGWHCNGKLEKDPDSEIWQRIRELTIRWDQLHRSDNPSIEEAEQIVAGYRQFSGLDDIRFPNALELVEAWLDGLKGGEGVNPLKKYEDLWSDPKGGQYALHHFGDAHYMILVAFDNGTLGDVAIEDDEVGEAVIEKMLEEGVTVLNSLSEEMEFVRHWHQKQNPTGLG